MDGDPRLSYLIAAILIYCAAWLAVTETALASVSRNKIKIAFERGDFRAEKALYALDNFEQAISTILICTNITHISAATIVTVTVTRQFGLSWVTLSTIIMTVLVFFFGEMLPKSIAAKYPEKFTLTHAALLTGLMRILKPLSGILTRIGNFAARITRSEAEISVTEEELHDIIDDLEEEGKLDEDESDLIQSAIEFGDRKIGSIYTPAEKIVALNIEDSPEEILQQIKEANHSRFPVFQGSLDNIIGILQIRDFIKEYLEKGSETDTLSLLSRPLTVRSNYNIDDILDVMADHQYTLAVVKDSQGKTLGVVSMEDILEELVGDIWDEDDTMGGDVL